MKSFLKTLTTVFLLAVVVFGVRELIFAQGTDSLLVSSNEDNVASAEREILSLLLELRLINISTDLFQSSAFKSLKDFGVVLDSQPIGRPNPFAPIGENEDVLSDNLGDELDDFGLDDFGDFEF